jgi:multimeric flavodoxin WrbA
MKTLILCGSPNRNGNCAALIRELTGALEGEVRVIYSYFADVKPCIDCRYCWKKPGCSIRDGMDEIYDCVENYDNIVIASPIHFMELSGSLLSLCSRFQTYFASRYFRGGDIEMRPKKGVLLLSSGQSHRHERALGTADVIFEEIGAKRVATVTAGDSDNVPARENEEALAAVREAARLLNGEETAE